MAERKLDLPDDLLSSKPSDHSWNPKVEASGSEEEKLHVALHDDTKDQVAAESSIPLSPQWLYSKPSDTKDMRALTSVSLGNANDGSQKEVWRLDGPDDKKDWRRIATENESSRRWREEERETGLLGARRDRRKMERRVENVSVRETTENRVLPSSDRWHDGSSRNSGLESRRDSKWSSRWGPEDKEKESRTEKRTDMEKDKEDAQIDNQSSTVSSRPVPDREQDSRDKWRPRHRMEAHSMGSNSYRAAPGFGIEKGRSDGSNVGFALGRGRSNAIGRGSFAGSIVSSQSYKSGGLIGKSNIITDKFCYPRGKLLDIYRRQKLCSSFVAKPEEMEESSPLTQDGIIEPLAFAAPDTEEEAILGDIWKGKITSSGVAYDSFRKGRSSENVSGVGEYESNEGSSFPSEVTSDQFQDVASNGENVDHEEGRRISTNAVSAAVLGSDSVQNLGEINSSLEANSKLAIGENGQMSSGLVKHFLPDNVESVSSLDIKSKLPDDSSSLFFVTSPDQDHSGIAQQSENISQTKDPEKRIAFEDLYLYYVDPHGKTQGPFLGADILLWFEEGYFGMDLPVRLADAPEGTPFQTLGEVMPSLKLREGYPSSEMEQSRALVGELKPDLPTVSVPENTDLPAVNELHQPSSDFSGLSVQHAHLGMSESEDPLQLPPSDGQSFQDFVAQDEEIVFPGRPGSSGYPTAQSSQHSPDPLSSSNGLPPLPNEAVEPGFSYQSDTKLHPFGLFWSELEGSQARQTESSNLSSTVGKPVQFGLTSDPASVAEKWANVNRQDILSDPSTFQDAAAAQRVSLIEPEPKHFDLAEQLMARKLQQQQQQQLQQRNILSSQSHLNESLLEHVPGQNLIHPQQLANHPVSDLEHLLALQQLQQQKLQQQQLQRQLQLQQQQFHQQQRLLQERQQSQARQVLLEQLLHGQIPDPGLQQPRVDPMRATVLDQVLLEQQLLHELQQQQQQQRSHHPQRHFVPSVEQQFGQVKFGHSQHQDQQRDLLELLSRAQHGQVQSLEQQILQEQLQARQTPMGLGLRQRMNMEEERLIDSMWNINENDHFLRGLAGNPRSHSSGISPLDLYQRQQRSLHEDQLSHLERNLSFQDRLRQGIYEPGSMPFERSLSLPAGASGMNMGIVNAVAHANDLDVHEVRSRMQSASQVGTLSSGSHPHNLHQPLVPNQFHVPHLDAVESRWPESSGPLANDWIESRMQQFHINAERKKRDSDTKITAEDSNFWMSDGSNDDKSRRLLMELLHQKAGRQSADSLQLNDGLSFEKRLASDLYSGSSSSDCNFGVALDQEAGLKDSYTVGSYSSNANEQTKVSSAAEHASHLANTEILPFRSESGATFEGHPSLLGISETPQALLKDSNFVDKLSVNRGYLDAEGRMYVSKSQGMTRGPVTEIQNGMTEQAHLLAADDGEVTDNVLSRHSSLNVAGFYDEEIGPLNSFAEDIATKQVHILSKGQENMLLRRPPLPRSSASQEGLSDLVSDTVNRRKVSGGVEGTNQANQGSDVASGKKDVRFRRTSSCGDADVSEPSFIDMLKSNNKKNPTAADAHMTSAGSESSDGVQGGRGKKKGKKGRQIDPALLGFKVTSNRIMMGEIQRIED